MTRRGSEEIQFKPTVTLCLDAEGRAIGSWLGSLLPSLDQPLRGGVALLAVNDGAGDGSTPLTGVWLDEIGSAERAAPALSDEEEQPVALETRIIEALRGRRAGPNVAYAPLLRRGVLDDAIISQIKDSGYGVPRGAVAVWIAAAATSPRLADVVAATRAALRSDGVEGWILLALTNNYPLDPTEHLRQEEASAAQPWEALLVGGPNQPPPVTFAYLFETHDERGHFWEGPGQTSYAAAEAIFTLTASGLTLTSEYETTLRRSLPRLVSEPQERMSSVGTSRLTFPRAQAERYCAYQLGATVLREWTPEQEVKLAEAEKRAQEAEAHKTVASLADEMSNSNALLETLRQRAQRRSRRQARENELPPDRSEVKLVYRNFSPTTVRPLLTPEMDLPLALESQRPLAEEGFIAWDEALFPAWSRYAEEAAKEIVQRADDLVLEGALGVERAYAYIFALNEALRDEQEEAEKREGRRAVRYAQALASLEKESEGPWVAALTQQPNGGATEDTRESRLSARLGARWRYIRAHQPTPITLGTVTILTAATLALLALIIAPHAWKHLPFPWLIVTLVALLVSGGLAYAFARYRTRLEETAAADLHQHYRAMYRFRVEQREAEWRATVLAMLRDRCERILDRLAHWEEFVATVVTTLTTDAELEERELFEGAVGRRDVLIANQRRLKLGGYTLRDFDLDVSKRRQSQPLPNALWHASPLELLARLRVALRGSVSLVEAQTEEIVVPVREYCLEIVRPYLTGDLVNLSTALDTLAASGGDSLLDALLERAALLYHPADHPRSSTTFVTAREPDLGPLLRGKQIEGLIALPMYEREWLAVARLLPGGARPDFLRPRAETTEAPLPHAPEWTSKHARVNGNEVQRASQNGGVAH
jgi:hypothetical protein